MKLPNEICRLINRASQIKKIKHKNSIISIARRAKKLFGSSSIVKKRKRVFGLLVTRIIIYYSTDSYFSE